MNYGEYIKKVLLESKDMGSYGSDFVLNYNLDINESSYLDDLFSEFADSNTSVYTDDVLKFICDNYEDVNDTINEFGWDGVGKSIITAGQTCEGEAIWRDLDKHRDSILLYMAAEYFFKDNYDDPVDEDKIDEIESLIQGNDYNKLSELVGDLDGLKEEGNLEERKQRRKRY